MDFIYMAPDECLPLGESVLIVDSRVALASSKA